MRILNNEPAMAILREAPDKFKAIDISWDMQTGVSTHGASVAAGYVASFLGNELTQSAPERFEQGCKSRRQT